MRTETAIHPAVVVVPVGSGDGDVEPQGGGVDDQVVLGAELEAIGGAVVCTGATHGIPVPVTARLVEQLRVRGLAPIGSA